MNDHQDPEELERPDILAGVHAEEDGNEEDIDVPREGQGQGDEVPAAAANASLEEQWRAALAEMHDEEFSDEGEEEEEDDDETETGDPTMRLSPEEREWAKKIKAAVEEDPDLDNLTDFTYAQFALKDAGMGNEQDRLESVLESVRVKQCFKEEKGFLDTCSHCKQILEQVMNLFPGFLLSIHYSDGGYTFVFDSTKIMASEFNTNKDAYKILVSTLVYVVSAGTPDFESTRNGVTFHVECHGFDLMKNFGVKVFSGAWTEAGDHQPTQWKVLKHFHTSMFKNVLVSMAKRFIHRGIHRKMEVGCVCEAGRLDKIYLVPDEAACNKRFMKNTLEFLQKRYDNEKSFTL